MEIRERLEQPVELIDTLLVLQGYGRTSNSVIVIVEVIAAFPANSSQRKISRVK